ncbi:MAG: hypothetical protein GXO57_02330 [Thermodesulfobacteria bacterium]|nr:hypothetical protein [Thermodesulfobacteriota bacterium]
MRDFIESKFIKSIPITILSFTIISVWPFKSPWLIKVSTACLGIIGIYLYWEISKIRRWANKIWKHSMKAVVSALFSGKVSAPNSAIIFFIYSGTFFKWLPSFLEEGKFLRCLSLAFACIDGFLFLFLKALKDWKEEKEKCEIFPEKRKVLIRAISFNLRDKEAKMKYLEKLDNTSCENFIENKNLPREVYNLGPLFKAIYYHADNGPLERVYLLVPRTLATSYQKNSYEENKLNAKILETLKQKIAICIGKDVVSFVEVEEGIDFENYYELRTKLVSLLKKIEKDYTTSDITVDISGGTSVVSAALILVAIKGHIQAQYISQTPPQVLKVINTDVFEISDLIEEFVEKIAKK